MKSVGLTLPPAVASALNLISVATLPLSLILVGSLALPRHMARGMARPLLGFVSSRLLLVPLATLFVVSLLGVSGVSSGVVVLQSAMPASVLATVMAREYGADADLAAAGALFTVLLSVVTVPLLASLLLAAAA